MLAFENLSTGKNIAISHSVGLMNKNLDFNFSENNILVYENVIYNSSNGKIETDNIKLNLISKKVEMFMNDNKKNIKVLSF